MLLMDHLLRVAGTLCQFFEFFGQFGFRSEQRSSVGCAVPDVDLDSVQNWLLLAFRRRAVGLNDGKGRELAPKLTTSPFASRYFFSTSPMTARDDLTSEIARRP